MSKKCIQNIGCHKKIHFCAALYLRSVIANQNYPRVWQHTYNITTHPSCNISILSSKGQYRWSTNLPFSSLPYSSQSQQHSCCPPPFPFFYSQSQILVNKKCFAQSKRGSARNSTCTFLLWIKLLTYVCPCGNHSDVICVKCFDLAAAAKSCFFAN